MTPSEERLRAWIEGRRIGPMPGVCFCDDEYTCDNCTTTFEKDMK